ncbi:MAG: regulatory protein RecX [Endomicrobiia bacterium]|nr:regulatory protein RecX [Endomicrobiia bacterium]
MKPRPEAFDYALKLLALRDRTRKEITGRLEKKKYSPEDILAALEKLEEYGYVNDEKFARSYAKSRMASGRALRLARLELIKKGIARELADRVSIGLKQTFAEEFKAAQALVRRKMPRNIRGDNTAARLAGLLARRGYSWDVVSKILKAAGQVSDEEIT